jgi:hypothetical protein
MRDTLYPLHPSASLLSERFRHLQCYSVRGPSDAPAVHIRSGYTVPPGRSGTAAARWASRVAASLARKLFDGVLHTGPSDLQPDAGYPMRDVNDIN